jgi:hypothetical protein
MTNDVNKDKISILHWILNNKIKNENGELIEFDNHRFMLDIYADRTPIQVIRKASGPCMVHVFGASTRFIPYPLEMMSLNLYSQR